MRSARLENRGVRIRNSDAQRHPKSQLNLVIQKKMARIQAAGVNGFVKGSTKTAATLLENPAKSALKQ
jgi:hypothetical protein